MKRRRLSSQDRRAQILAAARSLFAKKGYAEVSLDEIANRVGISRPRVIQLFGSKRNVYTAIAETAYRGHPMDKDLADPIERNDDVGVFQAFAFHCLKHASNKEELEIFKIFMYARFKEDDFHKIHFQEKERLMMSRLTDYVTRRIQEGVFRKTDPRIIVFCYQAMIWNLVMYKNMMKKMDFVTIEELSRECARMFVEGVKVRTPKSEESDQAGEVAEVAYV